MTTTSSANLSNFFALNGLSVPRDVLCLLPHTCGTGTVTDSLMLVSHNGKTLICTSRSYINAVVPQCNLSGDICSVFLVSYGMTDFLLCDILPSLSRSLRERLRLLYAYHDVGLPCILPYVNSTCTSHGYRSYAKSSNFEPVLYGTIHLNRGFWAPALR